MYYPYLRGRQNELRALLRFANISLTNAEGMPYVVPIVEPVRERVELLGEVTGTFSQKKRTIGVVINPRVGDWAGREVMQLLDRLREFGTDWIPVVLSTNCSEVEQAVDLIGANRDGSTPIMYMILSNAEIDLFNYTYPNAWALILPSDSRTMRRVFSKKGYKLVCMRDAFNAKARNADYAKENDEFFSDDLFFYRDEMYTGFGDYTILPNNFEEGGFLPRAIAIHMLYQGGDELVPQLRVHHFVSDENDFSVGIPSKFHEAVQKMDSFFENLFNLKNDYHNTEGLREFRKYCQDEHYPGLGVIKRLSILHHLELIQAILHHDK